MVRRLSTLVLVGLLAVVCGGCVINVDLLATPYSVTAGDPITYKVKVTNPLQCPVGGVFGFLFPLVPKDALISKIQDDDLREHLSHAVDEFCTSGTIEQVDHPGNCKLDSGGLVCEMDTGMQSPDTVVALTSTTGGDQVTCETNGTKIACRIPQRLVDMGKQTAAESNTSGDINLFPFTCHQTDGIFVCGALFLGPGEMKMDEVQLTTTSPGRFHNFVAMFATQSGGVCRNGLLPSVPCSTDSDCGTSASAHCGSGICQGGKSGFGCDADADCTATGICVPSPPPVGAKKCLGGKTGASCTMNADCTATGTCMQCNTGDGELLPGLACKNSEVIQGVQAPAMSPWSLAATAIGLAGTATILLRRRRRG